MNLKYINSEMLNKYNKCKIHDYYFIRSQNTNQNNFVNFIRFAF